MKEKKIVYGRLNSKDMTERTASCGCSSHSLCEYHRGRNDAYTEGYNEGLLEGAEKMRSRNSDKILLIGFFLGIALCIGIIQNRLL